MGTGFQPLVNPSNYTTYNGRLWRENLAFLDIIIHKDRNKRRIHIQNQLIWSDKSLLIQTVLNFF